MNNRSVTIMWLRIMKREDLGLLFIFRLLCFLQKECATRSHVMCKNKADIFLSVAYKAMWVDR